MSLVFSGSIADTIPSLHATRALVISGGLASMAALLAGVLMLCFMKKKNVLSKVAGVVAGLFNIAAGYYFTVKAIYTSTANTINSLINLLQY